MKYLIVRNRRIHKMIPEASGWPEETFISIDDSVPCQLGWLWANEAPVDPSSAEGQRILANQALADARIAAAKEALKGVSVAGMTAQQRADLILIMARMLGIEVKP